MIERFVENLAARISGPMHLRLILQPTMALIFAARAGLRDARSGQPPYFWAMFTSQSHRRELLRQGWKDVGKVFTVAVCIDVIYQLVTVRWIYPGESLAVATLLAFVPYILFRGAFTRLGRLFLVIFFTAANLAAAQDLEPKAYAASPVGTTFFLTTLSRSSGSVLTDPTLPITDLEAKILIPTVAVGHTFGLFGKLALFSAAVPYAWAEASGNVYEAAQSTTRSGLADARVKLSVNLRGNPAMRAREFAAAPRKTVVGVSLTVIAPTGQYDGTRLINLGTDRWAFRPEAGVSIPKGRWDLDAYLAVWLFARNDDFYPGGATRTQDPMPAFQAHASYTFRPRLWLAVDGTWYGGGATYVNGGAPSTAMNNSRLGVTLSLPAPHQQSFKVSYSRGAIVRSGSDFSTISVGWQKLWVSASAP